VVSPSTSDRARIANLPDAFGLLGLAPRYDVDAATLERAFFERSKEVHADKFATAPAAERVAALSKSRALNDAYQLLKRPASRAEYLLAREGIVIGDNERIDPALVMELLEEREVLAEARAAGKLSEVERLQAAMKARRTAALHRVKELFASEGERAATLAAIKQQLILLRYVERYLEECDSALDEE
jgi:molecular chaperone HscB